MSKDQTGKDKPEPTRDAKPPRAPRRSAKLADLEAVEKKLVDRDVRIADIGRIADQITEILTSREEVNPEDLEPGTVLVFGNDDALVKIEAILALVRGEDLGEWARARIGL